MTREEIRKQFIEAVERKGRSVTVMEIAEELYGGDPAVQRESAINIAKECKQAGLLLMSLDYQDISVTKQGLAFIGK